MQSWNCTHLSTLLKSASNSGNKFKEIKFETPAAAQKRKKDEKILLRFQFLFYSVKLEEVATYSEQISK